MADKGRKKAVRFDWHGSKYNILMLGVLAALIVFGWFTSSLGLFGSKNTEPPSQVMTGLYVHMIDVGQGDSFLVVADDRAMLIDGGVVDAGQTVAYYLLDHDITSLDYMVCTHAHADHCGGLDEVLKEIPVGTLLCTPGDYSDSGTYTYFLNAAKDVRLDPVLPAPGDTYALGGAVVTFLGPVKQYGDVNDTSLVLSVTYAGKTFLFTGDSGTGALEDILDAGYSLDCDVLKISHHGSYDGLNAELLEAMSPSAALCSCGVDNDYGFPHREILQLMEENNITLYRSDLLDDVVLYCDGETITLR